VVERPDRSGVAHFFAPEEYRAGASFTLSEEAAHHIRVARLSVGVRVGLVNGVGGLAGGTLIKNSKTYALVDVDWVESVPRPPGIHLLAPIGDRDRMLLLAEKAVEIGVSSWRPVLWRRSKSVSPRGEGPGFTAKLRSRMISALLQSRGAWLPDLFPDALPDRAAVAASEGTRILLDAEGEPIIDVALSGPVSLAIGPEGGLDPAERTQFVEAGFLPASLGANILRFETAGILAAGIVSSTLFARSPLNG
jgi:16S rRNA (uracil1498-N3)-methyltransferase